MTETSSQLPAQQARPSRLKGMTVVAILAAIAVTAGAVWQRGHTYHLAVVQEGVLYRDGFKSETQFAATLDSVHPHTVISLIDPAELADPKKPQFAQEEKLCSSRGIKLDRMPVKLGGWPTSDDIQFFLKTVSDTQKQPVLIHCAQGVRRTGFFVAAYQESVLGYDKSKAEQAILTFGHSGSTIEQIKRFIEGYDPQARTVPADLGRGSE